MKNYGIQNEGIKDYYRNKFARMFLNSQMIHKHSSPISFDTLFQQVNVSRKCHSVTTNTKWFFNLCDAEVIAVLHKTFA